MKATHVARMTAVAAALLLIGCDKDDGGSGGSYFGLQINAGNLSGPGTSLTFRVVHCGGSCTFDNGPDGDNQTWTFPDFNWTYEGTIMYVDPDSTPHAASFPTADRAMTEEDGYPYFIYESIRSDGCFQLGEADLYEFYAYPDPVLVMRLPLRIGTTWTSSIYDVDWYEQQDSTYWRNVYTFTADAWGSVVTPYDSVICLRVLLHTEYYYHEAGGETVLEDERYTFSWHDQQGNIVVKTIGPMNLGIEPDFNTGTLLMRVPPIAASSESARDGRDAPDEDHSLLRWLTDSRQ